jgi:hypothetical protein
MTKDLPIVCPSSDPCSEMLGFVVGFVGQSVPEETSVLMRCRVEWRDSFFFYRSWLPSYKIARSAEI